MIPQPEFYYSPSTTASSLSAVDPPSHPDPWLAPWMGPSSSSYYQQPTIQLQLPDIETLPIQRPLLLADDPYKAQQSLGPDQPSLIVPTAPCDYPTAVYAPRALQLALHPVPVPVPMSVPVLPPPPLPQASRAPAQASAPAPADVPIACPTPLHAYNKFDALLDFDPDDLLRHDALHSTPSRPRQPTAVPVPVPAPASAAPPAASNPVTATQHRRKRPHDECDPEPVSPRSKRARRSFSGSGVPERLTYPAAGAAPAVAREAPRHAPAAAPRARRAPPADRSHPHAARPLHHVPHCYNYSNAYTAPSWNHHPYYAHAVVAQRPAR